ncbi:MAG: hypothetical protein AB7N54_09665 [Alphaproteobacteria bacterium]
MALDLPVTGSPICEIMKPIRLIALAGLGVLAGGFDDRLSEREIAASIAFIKSTWPAAIRARQAGITARARAERRKP